LQLLNRLRADDHISFSEWHMDPNVVNHSQVGNVFMLGVGGPIVVALAAYFGRYPVLFWFILLAVATAIWCAAAQSFESFMVSTLQLHISRLL
jgi:hypothetical protein